MKFDVLTTVAGSLSQVSGLAAPIDNASDFLDLLMNAGAETLVLRKEDLAELFFDLRSGLAGEILQKVSNYRKRLVVLGDFGAINSRSLRDFIQESNQTGQVVFAQNIDEAARLLR